MPSHPARQPYPVADPAVATTARGIRAVLASLAALTAVAFVQAGIAA